MSGLRAAVDGDSLVIRARLARQGTASYLGTVRGALINASGSTAGTFETPISVYYDIDPRFAIGAAGLPPGRYLLRFSVTSERTDIAAEQTLKAPTVRDSIEVPDSMRVLTAALRWSRECRRPPRRIRGSNRSSSSSSSAVSSSELFRPIARATTR